MQVEVVAALVAAVAVIGAVAIHGWHPDWQPARLPGQGRVAVQAEAPRLDAPAPFKLPPDKAVNPKAMPVPAATAGQQAAQPGATPARWAVAVGNLPSDPDAAPPSTEPPSTEPAPDAAPPSTEPPSTEPAPDAAPQAPSAADAAPATAQPAKVPDALRAGVGEPDPFRPRSGKLSVARVTYDDSGQVIFEGSASPGRTVRIRLDGASVGQAAAGADGRWLLQPNRPIAVGRYQLLAEELASSGNIAASVALPFARAENTDDLPMADRLVVQPGNNLWRLAEQLYGSGQRYELIFQANRDQIQDPDLIFPGQIFHIPPNTP